MFLFFQYFLYLIGGLIVLTTALALYLAFFQPRFNFPKPTGQYAVGTTTHHWVDATRNKELMVQFWYPATGKLADTPTTPYAPYGVNHIKKTQKLIQRLILTRPLYSFAIEHAPLINNHEQLPIIIFSHGLNSTRNYNTAHCEELASHGYLVVGISHSFGCTITDFPDEHRQWVDQDGLSKLCLENPADFIKQLDNKIEIWVDDVQMVLDKLTHLQTDSASPLHNRLAMDKIGMFGHSYGGAASLQLCRRDQRIKAGVNMDGILVGPNHIAPFDKPFMFMLTPSESDAETIAQLRKMGMKPEQVQAFVETLNIKGLPAIHELIKSIGHDIFSVTIRNAEHNAFCDMVLAKEAWLCSSLLANNLGAGSINGFRATEITRNYLVNFFDMYLKDKPSELLDGDDTKYPECTVEK